MTLYKELSYDNDISKIQGIQFSVMSPDDIINQSVVEITKSDTFERNEPTPNGLFDPRLGVIEHGKICVTCEQKNNFCPGHFGHIVLAKPVFYIQFFNIVKNILKCVCYRCSNLLLDTTSEEIKAILKKKMSQQKRWEIIFEKIYTKIKKCQGPNGCGAKQPSSFNKEGVLKIAIDWKDSQEGQTRQVLDAEDVLRIFKRISDADAAILGFGKGVRPEYLICTVLPVPPPAVRPSVRNDAGQRSEDDLTHKLSSIIKNNNKLKTMIGKSNKDNIDMQVMLLQYEVATLIDNTSPEVPPSQQRTGRPIRSLIERLKGKEGRIRGNLMGKRVDFSARSVITPDPNISIDELGVPIKIAMNLTFPEVVNKYNIDSLRKLVNNGPDKYPGAKFVRKDKRTIRLKDIDRSNIELEYGDIVDRHMQDGDYVLFNRQPSLHRSSMMAHKVKIMPYNTFRLNVMVTPSFNADFDGDEMNAHIPQSYQTHEELVQLAAVPTQIISPRECKPIISIVQDIVLGLYRMTKSYVRIDLKQFMNLMVTNPECIGILPKPIYKKNKHVLWSGHQILSTIMPKKINIKRGNSQYDENSKNDDHFIKIINGQVLSGCFDKDIYQSRTVGIVHSIFNEYGPEETKIFLDNTQKLICNWLVYNGFSVGISDLVVNNETINDFSNTITNMKKQVYTIIDDIHSNKYEQKSTKSKYEDFEKRVNDILNDAVKKVGDAVSSQIDDKTNRMINMIKSKAKGNTINVSQMIGCIGQQNVDGKRIPYGFDDRTLPHYSRFNDGPESRGFIQSSFINGLKPEEFFFAAMGGREGLIDTAVNTSETGYIQRKLIKAMEDCKVYEDRSVRTANGSIIQFLYGDDGMDSSKIESHPIVYMNEDIDSVYDFKKGDLNKVLHPDIFKIVKERKPLWYPRFQEHLKQLKIDKDFIITKVFKCRIETSLMYPISILRTLDIADGLYTGNVCDITPEYVLDKIDELCTELYITENHPGNKLFHMLIRMYLSPRKIIIKHMYCKEAFDYVIDQIKKKYFESLTHPGEMVGVIAAQSIGEPATQLTLNSVEWNTEILLDIEGNLVKTTIGSFIDQHVDTASSANRENHENDTTLVWIKDKTVKVLSCDENGKITWKLVEAVTKHPPINKDGSKTLLKITTESGRTVTATKAKSFIKRIDNKIVPVNGDELNVGDYLPVSNILPLPKQAKMWRTFEIDSYLGYFIASYINYGYLDANKKIYTKKTDKNIAFCRKYYLDFDDTGNELVINNPILFALFDQDMKNKQMPMEILHDKKALLTFIQEIDIKNLSSNDQFVIKTVIGAKHCNTIIPDVDTVEFGKLTIDRSDLTMYYDQASIDSDKLVFQNTIREDILYDRIISIEEVVSSYPYVYDLTVQDTRNFNIYNGLAIRDTFHLAGVSAASKTVRGVPRLKELLSVSKNLKTPMMKIHFKDEYKTDFNKCNDIMHDICIVKFKDIIKKSQILFDPNDTYKQDINFVNLFKECNTQCSTVNSPWLLRVTFDKESVYKYHLSMSDIRQKLHEYYGSDLSCICSDINAEELVCRIKLNTDSEDVLTELKALEHNILEKITIKGVDKIDKVFINKQDNIIYDPISKSQTREDEWIVYTEGTNMADMFAHPLIDCTKLYSNNVKEIYEILGIEAARQALYNEIQEVLESITVNYRHISHLVDVQTNKGFLLSIDRHGINRGDIGPLAKCSFEETTEKLIKAGIFCEHDNINGVSANIMLGQIVPAGTGTVDVIIDETMLPVINENEMEENEEEDDENTEICDMQNFSIQFNVPKPKVNKHFI